MKVTGRSDLIFYLGLIKKTLAVLIFFVTYRYGVIAILLGQIVGSVLTYLPNSYHAKKLIGYSVREQLADIIPSLLLASSIGCVMWVLQGTLQWPEIIEFLILSCVGAGAYISGAWMLRLDAILIAQDLIENRMKGKLFDE